MTKHGLPERIEVSSQRGDRAYLVSADTHYRTIAEAFWPIDAPAGFRQALASELVLRWNAHEDLCATLDRIAAKACPGWTRCGVAMPGPRSGMERNATEPCVSCAARDALTKAKARP